jgi:hypothetical protein
MFSNESVLRRQIPWLAKIPPEILSLILPPITNRDRKSLRLTCKVLGDITPLSFSRVFLSANSLDIEVFRAIADYSFRHGITEIIWDDARFDPHPFLVKDKWPATTEHKHRLWNGLCPVSFAEACEENIKEMRHRKGFDSNHPHHASRQEQVKAQMSL